MKHRTDQLVGNGHYGKKRKEKQKISEDKIKSNQSLNQINQINQSKSIKHNRKGQDKL